MCTFKANGLILPVIFSLLLSACDANKEKCYDADQVNEATIIESAGGSHQLAVVPMLETLYFFQGVVLEEKQDAVYVHLVRCKNSEKCKVDAEAQLDLDTPGRYIVDIPHKTNKPIKLNFASDKRQIWP